MISRINLIIFLSLLYTTCFSQKLASFEVNIPGEITGFNISVSIDLNDITYLPDTLLRLRSQNINR